MTLSNIYHPGRDSIFVFLLQTQLLAPIANVAVAHLSVSSHRPALPALLLFQQPNHMIFYYRMLFSWSLWASLEAVASILVLCELNDWVHNFILPHKQLDD